MNGATAQEPWEQGPPPGWTEGEDDPPPKPPRHPTTIAEVLNRWEAEGPLVHEPTGLGALDEALGGGPTYGSRAIIQGAPDAGKTALLYQIAETLAARGVVVGFHAVDEEDSDLVTRAMQRHGFRRAECEARGDALDPMRERLTDALIFFYDGAWSIEDATTDLATRAAGKRLAYLVDSIQTVTCDKTRLADREPSERAMVTANMLALRSTATKHRLIAIATSEMNRNAYRGEEASGASGDMAAGAESRAIEYQARWMVSLRNVKGEPDLVRMSVVKNKLGPGGQEIYLRINRASQTLRETDYTPPPPTAKPDTLDDDAEAVKRVILSKGTVNGITGLRAAVKAAKLHLSHDKVAAAVEVLTAEGALEVTGKANRPRWRIRGAADEADQLASEAQP